MATPLPAAAPAGSGHRAAPVWTWAIPVAAWLALGVAHSVDTGALGLLSLAAVLLGTVLAAVHHAEVIAHRVGEPYGSLVLGLAVTVIEVALIVSIMISDGSTEGSTLARDTVFATLMLASNGVLGVCLVVAAIRYGEPEFETRAAASYLAVLTVLAVAALVLPTFTRAAAGPIYSTAQLMFVGLVSILLYAVFLYVQTVRHRGFFLPPVVPGDDAPVAPVAPAAPPTARATGIAAVLLTAALAAVVLLAKQLAPEMEALMRARHVAEPAAVVGVLVAAIVLLPESLAAVRAARRNLLQISINLALGSALASIALTIPIVAVVAIAIDEPLILGLSDTNEILLGLTLIVSTLTLGARRATILQGAVHLFVFALFLFLVVVP